MFDFIKDTFDTIQDVILMFVLSVQSFFVGIASLAETIFEMINGKGTDDYQLIGAILAIFFGIVGIAITFMFIGQVVVVALALISVILTVVIAVLTTLVDYIIPAVPLFIIARRNNYKYPWFAFIPIMQSVLEFNLPDAKFEVLFFRSKPDQRLIYAIVSIFLSISLPVVGLMSIGDFYVGIIWLLMIVFYVAFCFRKMYDLMNMYFSNKIACTLSVLSILVPIIYPITLFVMLGSKRDVID